MKVDLRIPGALYTEALADLRRPHAFAAERVGFITVAIGRLSPSHVLLLAKRYSPVADEHYIDDPFAGARINSDAIRAALQRILDHGEGQLHVHIHEHRGLPMPSRMDSREMPPLLRSMAVTNAACAHGALIFSDDGAWAEVMASGPDGPLVEVDTITVVGFPLLFLK
jgi:hypothetical protein